MNIAMILAGGNGTRVGANLPKQFIKILGKPVLAYTIEIYQHYEEIDAIEIVCNSNWIKFLEEMVIEYNFTKVKWIVEGGETFQKSVINGIDFLKKITCLDDIVMIHYGAAPLTSSKILADGIKVCKDKGMSVSCVPCYQLMGTNNGDVSEKWVDRDRLIQITCPQSFKFGYLLKIYEDARKLNLLDTTEPHTTSLMYALGEKIYISYGDQTNFKITTKEDLDMFEGYLLMKQRRSNEFAMKNNQ